MEIRDGSLPWWGKEGWRRQEKRMEAGAGAPSPEQGQEVLPVLHVEIG